MQPIFVPADILLPQTDDWEKWSVVACDQYTSQPEYWKKVEDFVGSSMSTLRLILPEVYLESADADARIAAVCRAMRDYMPHMREVKNSFIYTKRTLPGGKVRHGLIGALDLEAYRYEKGAHCAVRATEGTVLERIPPRMRVRKNASLELPHVMLLADDREKTLIEPLSAHCSEKLYDFALMMGSGHVTGYRIDAAENAHIQSVIADLANAYIARTGESDPFVLAVGDGNHSLATAKACYEEIKKTLTPAEAAVHPARYALAELVNLHDEALEFEPIHRVVFGAEPEKLLADLARFCQENTGQNAPQTITYVDSRGEGILHIEKPVSPLAVGTLQRFLDEVGAKVDYIHGEDVTRRIGSMAGNIGFLLPPMEKTTLFDSVRKDGALPRKTFSMGAACEKRFYLEARAIIPDMIPHLS